MMVDPHEHVHEVGSYHCAVVDTRVKLVEPVSLADLEWPVVVEVCEACGRRHVLQYEDVHHPPAYGYE